MEILGNDSLDTVWIEATPTFTVGEDDNWGGGVSEAVSEFKSLRVGSDIPLHELNVSLLEQALRENASVARGGSDNSDQ